VDSGPIPEDSVPFLWILLNSGPIPLESTGMNGFLQESVGHQKVLTYATNFELEIEDRGHLAEDKRREQRERKKETMK